MSQMFDMNHGTSAKVLKQLLVLFYLVLSLSWLPASAADDYDYVGEVTGGTSTLLTLVPVGSTMAGPVTLNSTPGGSSTDVSIFTNALLVMFNAAGSPLFCFNFNKDCDGGVEVPIISIDTLSLMFDAGGCPIDGSIDLTTHSNTFNIDIPITLNITAGTFSADAGGLGTSTGLGTFDCPGGPEIDASPNPLVPLNFTEAFIGGAAQTQTITITNSGTEALTIGTVAITGDNDFSIGPNTCSNSSVAPMGTCTIAAVYTPINLDLVTATLSIPSNDADENPVEYSLASTGLNPPGIITSDGPLLITDTPVGSTMTGDITITNASVGPLTILQISALDLDAPFSITSDMCSMTEVAGLGSCVITIQFAPTMVGDFSDTLNIPSDDPVTPTLAVLVSSAAAVPVLTPATTTLTIPNTMLNNTMSADLEITNDGTAPLLISDLTGLAAPFAVAAEDCIGVSIVPLGSCTVTISFSPLVEGPATAMLSIASNDALSPTVMITINGIGTEELLPELSLSVSELNYSAVVIGQSEVQSVTVQNVGTALLLLNGFTVAPIGQFEAMSGDCGVNLAPTESCTFTVTFTPTSVGPHTAILTVASNDTTTRFNARAGGGGGNNTVALNGTGVAPTPDISVSATMLDFGVRTVGQSATNQLIVSNDGSADLSFDLIDIAGSDYGQTNNCTVLIPGAMCTITVTFTPSVDGVIAANLSIDTNDLDEPSVQIALTGRGTFADEANIITAPVSALDLGSEFIGSSTSDVITVTNNGSANLTISAVNLIGANVDNFSSVDNCVGVGIVLAADSSCTITVTFAAMAPEGAKVATLIITSDDADEGMKEISLAGMAVTPLPDAMFSTTALIMANTVIDEMSIATITVTNVGPGDLEVSAIATTDPIAAPFSINSETCTAGVIVTNASCVIEFMFEPTVVADFNDTINFDSNDAGAATSLMVQGSGIPVPMPDISADTTTLDLGAVVFGDTGSALVTITNVGSSDLTISEIEILPMGDFSAMSDCAIVAPSSTCVITVNFAPSVQGAALATLAVSSDDDDTPVLEIDLAGMGLMPDPEIDVTPTSVDAGAVVLGQSATSSVTVSNQGTTNLTVSSVVISGANAADFSQTNDCSSVASNSNCTVTLTFMPSVVGASAALLTITSNDADEGTVEVALSGMATAMQTPIISVGGPFDFGDVIIAQSGMLAIDVTNSGTGDLTINGVIIGGANAGSFSQTNTCATPIAPMSTCSITVRFTPMVIGAASAEVSIVSTDPASAISTVNLTGVGITGPQPMAMIVVPDLNLGNVSMGGSSSSAIVISNAGSDVLMIDDVTVTGMGASDFAILNPCATVAAGSTCTVTVTYTPSIVGNADVNVTVVTNDPVVGTVTYNFKAVGAPMEEVVVTVQSDGGNGSFGLIELGLLMLFATLVRRRQRIAPWLLAVGIISAPCVVAEPLFESEAPQKESYWYIGGSFGNSNGQGDTGEITRNIELAGASVSSLSFDDSDSGGKAFIGYQATEKLGIELAYVDLGKADINVQLGGITIDRLPAISRTISNNLSLLGNGLSGSVVLRQPFKENISVFAKVGLVSWEVETSIGGSVSGDAINITEVESGTDITFGVGGEMWFGKSRFGARIEWERYQLGEQDAEFVSIGGLFKF